MGMSARSIIAVDDGKLVFGSVNSVDASPRLQSELDLSAEMFLRNIFAERFVRDATRREERMTLRAVLAEHAAESLDDLIRNALQPLIERSTNSSVGGAREQALTSIGKLTGSLRERNWDRAIAHFLGLEAGVDQLIFSMKDNPDFQQYIAPQPVGKIKRSQSITFYLDTIMERLASIHGDAEILRGERPEGSAPILIN